MLSVAAELEQKTNLYWKVSRVWNGRTSEHITVGDALADIAQLVGRSNPNRPIHFFACNLLEELVEGESPEPQGDAKLLAFPDPADILSAAQ